MDDIIKKIVDFIIEEVQTKSTLSGFQYIVGYDEIAEKFEVALHHELTEAILDALALREEVADVVDGNDGFDVVLYTEYAPNYNPADYET